MTLTPIFRQLTTALVAIWLTAQTACAEVVATPATLPVLLAAAMTPDIRLAPGEYSDLILRDRHGLTLTADPENPAVFKSIRIARSSAITLDGLVIEGDLATTGTPEEIGYPEGLGLSIRASEGITLRGLTIRRVKIGIYAESVTGLTVDRSRIEAIRLDGIEMAQVKDVRITGNVIRDFLRAPDAGDHADMIQLWTTGTGQPSENITISGNLLDAGTGLWTQSIFMRNEAAEGARDDALWYRNIEISDNVIRNAHHHGITVGEVIGLTIRDNQVLFQPDAIRPKGSRNLYLPAINVAETARDVTITGNVFYSLSGFRRQPDWTVTGNRSARNLSQ